MMPRAARFRVLGAVLLLPFAAWAGVGHVTTLTGKAERASPDGTRETLAVGSEAQIGDTLEVADASYLKLTLNDGSMVALGPGSVFQIDQANFAAQERQAFSAKLWVGKFWAKVTKTLAGSDAKFHVHR